MLGNNLKCAATVSIEMKLGNPDFKYKTKNTLDLIMLLVCLFLKTRWLLTGQDELENFQLNFNDLIKDDNFPDSISGISSMFLFKSSLDGKTTIEYHKNKNNDVGITSYFPFSYSNIDIINIGVIYVDMITALFDEDAKNLCKSIFRLFKDIILDDNNDESNDRLLYLFGVASEFLRQVENT